MKCSKCGAPTLLGFVHGDRPIICGPCQQAELEVKA